MYILIGLGVFFLIILVMLWLLPLKYQKIEWIETNAKIIESGFSHRTVGNEITYASGESQRRVKLTVQFSSLQNKPITVTNKVWTYTKNRSFFEEGKRVTILYNKKKPQQFKLKYQI
ncbi:hypothetical protein ACQKP0_24470 [Heyndrickxia sp. NPDC080065]|uniref:hypothetical protein n=1 Tax=Heyndrickxia sp. NPDC080065 TaxID=3390568 RepID=UPI003D023026